MLEVNDKLLSKHHEYKSKIRERQTGMAMLESKIMVFLIAYCTNFASLMQTYSCIIRTSSTKDK
jgi:hypothetical protein